MLKWEMWERVAWVRVRVLVQVLVRVLEELAHWVHWALLQAPCLQMAKEGGKGR